MTFTEITPDAMREHFFQRTGLGFFERVRTGFTFESPTETFTQKGFKQWYETKIKILLNCRSQMWDLIRIFPGKSPPIWNPWLASLHTNLLFHPERAPISSQAALAAARAECRARPSEMFTFQLWVVFNHTAGCLTAHSTAWPLFTSPCFRPALYAQSGRPRDGLSGRLLRLSAEQRHGQAEWKAAWRYTENAPVWLTQSA